MRTNFLARELVFYKTTCPFPCVRSCIDIPSYAVSSVTSVQSAMEIVVQTTRNFYNHIDDRIKQTTCYNIFHTRLRFRENEFCKYYRVGGRVWLTTPRSGSLNDSFDGDYVCLRVYGRVCLCAIKIGKVR